MNKPQNRPTTFALYFGNRGFFPESLIAAAREELTAAVTAAGYAFLLPEESLTRYGAVETSAEGRAYAAWLETQRGNFDGVILCLPNFGDENGAIAALEQAGVPIFVQAYPDEMSRMDFAQRRDAFCGKLSIMDVFGQYGVPFTTFPPHVVRPGSAAFAEQVRRFAVVCRVVGGMRRMTVGAIGARTTAFKTIRFDELALQRHGITTETLDLSEVLRRVRSVDPENAPFLAKRTRLRNYTNWTQVPDAALDTLSRLGVVLDEIIAEYRLDALALRCWLELEQELGVSPCVLLSEINDRRIPAACELDVCSAISMHALQLAAQRPATCLDWNNNYGDEEDKCILFHCGPVPQSLMTAKGAVIDHPMFAKSLGAGCGYGCNVGRIAPAPLTFASAKTEAGALSFYVGEGAFTDDPIPDEFFGCAGVARIARLQHKLDTLGHAGYRHHVGVTTGHVADALREAFTRYLGYSITEL